METMTLTAVVLASILHVTANSHHVNGEDLPRLKQVAATIVSVTKEKGCIVSTDEDCELTTAMALVGIDFHESGFASDVQDCSKCVLGGAYCDHGRAQTAFQLQYNNWGGHTRNEICADFNLATSLAYDALAKGKGSWKNKFRVYAGRAKSGKELQDVHESLLFFARKYLKPTNSLASP